MKRIFFALVSLLICISTLASCSDSYMVKYRDDKIGLYYELPKSLEEYKYGDRGTYKNYRNESGTLAVVITYNTNEALLASGAFDTAPTLEEYITHTIEDQQLGEIDIDYSEDNTRATFDLTARESVDDAGQYIYNTFIKNEKGIYIIQMLCLGTMYENYAPQFERWSNICYAY